MTTSAAMPATARANRIAYLAVHIAFVANGIVTTLLGPMLPLLAQRWHLNDAQLGRLFIAQFVGSTLGVLISGPISARNRTGRTILVGYIVMAVGLALLPFSAWPAGWGCIFIYGTAIGLTIPATNLFVAEVTTKGRAAALSILNSAWTAGAIVCPWLVSISGGGTAGRVIWPLAAVLVLLAGVIGFGNLPAPKFDPPPAARNIGQDIVTLLAFGLLFFLYVGTETSLAGWITLLGQRTSGDAQFGWTLTSLFWAALLTGRLTAPLVLKRLREPVLLSTTSLVAVAGIAAVAIGTNRATTSAGVLAAGLGLAAVFPLVIAVMTEHYGAAASRAASLLFALAGIGGATLPWLVGTISRHYGALRAGLMVPLAGAMVMVLVNGSIVRLQARPHS